MKPKGFGERIIRFGPPLMNPPAVDLNESWLCVDGAESHMVPADLLAERLERARLAFSTAYAEARGAEDRNTFWAHYAHWLLIGSSLPWYELELFEPYGLDIYDTRMQRRDLIDLRHKGVRVILYRFEAFAEVRDEIIGPRHGARAQARRRQRQRSQAVRGPAPRLSRRLRASG
jgi:hypothetical protein